MKQFTRKIALFLTLVVLSNGLFAAHMTVTMIEGVTKVVSSVDEKPPCHGDAAANAEEKIDCCQGDCTGCVLSTGVPDSLAVDFSNILQAEKLAIISNHLLPVHRSNLFRPPILI